MLLFASIIFLIFIMVLLWNIKSDFFFIVFGVAAFLYILIELLVEDPFKILLKVIEFVILNPLGLIILFLPIFCYLLYNYISRIRSFLGKKN
jgi:hypothetical protein